jgi:hypothetical protein
MRISLIGPGNIKFHYQELLGIPEEDFKEQVRGIALALSSSGCEIELLPDDGICLEIARIYKENNGKKVIATLPLADKTFGVNHLKQYLEEKVSVTGEPLFDSIIDSGDWFKHDMIKGLMGNAILYLGSSPGTDGERHYAIYLYKLIAGFKKGVKVQANSLHPQALAGENFTVYVYTPFIKSGRLPLEDEEYMKRFNVNLVYIKNSEQLRKELKKKSQD